jgi:hypothetical protein
MPNDLPILTILPVSRLLLHEEPDEQRSSQLTQKLLQQGSLKNPPLVMPCASGSDQYIVLDGANRVTAFRRLGYPHILVQVVDASDPGLGLSSWNHLVWGQPVDEFLSTISQVAHLLPDPGLQTDPPQVQILLGDQRSLVIPLEAKRSSQFDQIHRLVSCYKGKYSFYRTDQADLDAIQDLHPDLSALLIFPSFTIPVILQLATQGLCLPSGITRFTVPQRALHLNYPLQELSTSTKSLSTKQEEFQHWIEQRLRNRNIRRYSEPTVLYDD